MGRRGIGTSTFFTLTAITGCSNGETPPPPPPSATEVCGQLRSPTITDIHDQSGNKIAINFNECATIYDPNTLLSIGVLAANAPFTMVCDDGLKPVSWRIIYPKSDGTWHTGAVHLDADTAKNYADGRYGTLPECPPYTGGAPSPVPSPKLSR